MREEDFDDLDALEDIETDPTGELFEHHRFVADPGQGITRVDHFLVNRVENASRTKIQEAANAGCILVNNKPVKSNYRVKPSDVVSIVLSFPPREITIIPENIPLPVVHEDESLIVINKPPGLVVHPGHGNYTGTLVNGLAWHFRDKPWFTPGDPRPGLVHRIDKDTSGLMVVAKTEMAKVHLARQFFDKTTTRAYLALAWGTPDPLEGTINGHIGRSTKDRMQMAVYPGGEQGKPATTHYKVVEKLGYVSLVECRLETGRTHQIRAHFKYLGHPLFNDKRYGGDIILKGTTFAKYQQFVQNCFTMLPRQALHAKTLGFIHPATGKEMKFDSELPEDISKVIEKWRDYIAGRSI